MVVLVVKCRCGKSFPLPDLSRRIFGFYERYRWCTCPACNGQEFSFDDGETWYELTQICDELIV